MNGTIAEILRGHAANDAPALLFEDRRWTYREYVQACAERAALLLSLRRDGPFHVGVLLDNVLSQLSTPFSAQTSPAAITT